ncbi:MAG: hypothetical protein IK072_00175 [Clostridia bacterium]|nr:hypothetical protein [Clostridia bacterium]
MTLKNSDNKSLLIYTSLIFFVAIIMIIVSFFAQTHLDQTKVSELDLEKVTLSNKAAQVSEENMQLVELNKSLKDTNTELLSENSELKERTASMQKELDAYAALSQVSEKLLGGNKRAARSLLENIYTEDLTQKQKEIYDTLVKKTE